MKPDTKMLIIVPPFAGIDRPSLGVHTIQAVAKKNEIKIGVLYANLVLASMLGEIEYETICFMPTLDLFGERIIGNHIHDNLPEPDLREVNARVEKEYAKTGKKFSPINIEFIRSALDRMTDVVIEYVSWMKVDAVGFSTTFEQTNATALLARSIRRLNPNMILIAGGANCEDEMAQAIKDLIPELNHVFSGESENDLWRFLKDEPCSGTIIRCQPNKSLDDLPENDYQEYFWQLHQWLPDSIVEATGNVQIPYETSRGCWWGQKHHCTFCGLNGEGISYRKKSSKNVLHQLESLSQKTGVSKICMADNIMPHSYFKELLPALAESESKMDIFFEQKANMRLEDVTALKLAGVNRIQPGIESLSTKMLKLMRKGITARQNIALMRYSRSVGIDIAWNLIHGFPEERKEWYEDMLRIIPLIHHLEPPSGLCRLSIDRFSPYFSSPSEFGLSNIRPVEAYEKAFPAECDLKRIAYHFRADYRHESGINLIWSRVDTAIEEWREKWFTGSGAPMLFIASFGTAQYCLIDTRDQWSGPVLIEISEAQARVALAESRDISEEIEWALSLGLVVSVDDVYVPLACAAPTLIAIFEKSACDVRRHDVPIPLVVSASSP